MRKISLAVAGLISAGILAGCSPKLDKISHIDKEIETAYMENQKLVNDTQNSFSYKANTSLAFPYLLTVGLAESMASSVGGPVGQLTSRVMSVAGDVAIQKNGFGVKVLYEDPSIKTKDCRFYPLVWTRDEKLYYELFQKVDLNTPRLREAWFNNYATGKYPLIPIIGMFIPFSNHGVKFVENKEETKNRFSMFVFDGRRQKIYEAYATITYIGRVDVDGKPARMFLMTGAYNGYAWEEMRRQISQVCIKDRE